MLLATLLALSVGQADASLPRVIRLPGKVCVEALDDRGELKRDCRAEGAQWSAPSASLPPPQRSGPRGVSSISLALGVLTGGATLPEVAFLADAGVLFPNGTGFVGLLHAQVSPVIGAPDFTLWQRYGVGAALRLGTRSHFLLGVSGTLRLVQDLELRAAPAISILMKGALVISDSFTLVLMPIFGLDEGVTFSMTVGIGATL